MHSIYATYQSGIVETIEVQDKQVRDKVELLSQILDYTRIETYRVRGGKYSQVSDLSRTFDRSLCHVSEEKVLEHCHGNTLVGYVDEYGNTFCLDHSPEHTVEEILDVSWNAKECCRTCGRNLVERELINGVRGKNS